MWGKETRGDGLFPDFMKNKSIQKRNASAQNAKAAAGGGKEVAGARGGRFAVRSGLLQPLTYVAGFLLLFVLTGWVYGDVLQCTEQYSYVSAVPDTMSYVTSQPLGWLWMAGRWALLCCRWAALGGAVLSAVFTLTAWLVDRAFGLRGKWTGAGFIVSLLVFGWIAFRGVNIFYRNEPSLLVIVPVAVMLLAAVLCAVSCLVRRKSCGSKSCAGEKVAPYGLTLAAALIVGACAATRIVNENTILTARFKLLAERQDWETIIEDTRAARCPSRAVAAYYAIALEQTGQLLSDLFDIPYDFPTLKLDKRWGSEEYGIFTADCNFYAGLTNGAYRSAMDSHVMNGPALCNYKRMAASALVGGEYALCRKYLDIIAHNPFEGDFVQRYEALLAAPAKVGEDAEFSRVIALSPKDSLFEQNYQQPLFLGYNVGLQTGTDASLATSVAACLYSKDLQRFAVLAQIMQNKGMALTAPMQQAIAILALNRPEMLKAFPTVGRFVPEEVRSFLLDAKPYVGDSKRLELRAKMKKQWLGTYMYYYYTENNDPDRVIKRDDDSSHSAAGVN